MADQRSFLREWTTRLFGFQFASGEKSEENKNVSFAPRETDDGALVVSAGANYGTYLDLEGSAKTEAELVAKYREMSLQPECEMAVEDIMSEAIVKEDKEKIVDLDLDDLEVEDVVKEAITLHWEKVVDLLDFNNAGYEIFRRWYIDGRLYYHAIIDKNRPLEGIQELRYVDPRKIRKIRTVRRVRKDDIFVNEVESEYYMYNERGFKGASQTGQDNQGVKITVDSIVHLTSGIVDRDNKMVLSFLHKAIKPLNQLRIMEDATVIYRISRAPERRIFGVDVGQLPKMKAEQYVKDMMTKHKNRLIYDATTGDVRDDRKFMCYALDTRIPLLDGRTLTLQEIMDEYEAGKLNWVYSCDPETGKFMPGPVSWAGVTKKNAQVVRVTFDNGESVICTPDHKFPVWGRGMVEAKDLVGESIIPGYRRKKSIGKDGQEYEQIYKNETKTWEFTHREVARWMDTNDMRQEMLHDETYALEDKKTIHHMDYDRFNNSPENLAMMNRYDHIKYHADCARYAFIRTNKSEDFTPEWRAKISVANKGHARNSKTWKVVTPTGDEHIIENLSAFCRDHSLNRSNIKGQFGSKGYHAEQLRNHKAVSVEWLDEKIDVGCLTVDLDETYHSNHTYLLAAGVYTKNTMIEDYWFPMREGKGTTVQTLPAGQNLGEMTDVRYFEEKLYRSLNVPVSHLLPETGFSLGRSSEITRDELKFQKFILRLRSRFTQLFLKVLEKQLVLAGVMTVEDWNQFKNKLHFNFRKDNFFAELKNEEILRERITTLQMMEPYMIPGKPLFSTAWAQKNVLQMTDEDIEQMGEEIEEEIEIAAEQQMALNPQMAADVEQTEKETDQIGKPPPLDPNNAPPSGPKKPKKPAKKEAKKPQRRRGARKKHGKKGSGPDNGRGKAPLTEDGSDPSIL